MTATFDAILIAFRKTKDGDAVTFVIHHADQDNARPVRDAHVGSQWQIQAVPLDDDGNARGGDTHQRSAKPELRAHAPDNAQPASAPQPARASKWVEHRQAVKARRSWDDMTPAQQAGVLCADKAFQKFMTLNTNYEPDEPTVAQLVRNHCGVSSRAIIAKNDVSSLKWDELVSHYRAWMREPQVVPHD